MIKIAVVEDSDDDAENLISNLNKYSNSNGLEFDIDRYVDAESFTERNQGYDIVFMDIMMNDMDGMSAAKKLRESDKDAVLVFVTNMVQFALEGYSVNAFDFMVKPISYYNFALKMDRIYEYTSGRLKKEIIVSSKTAKTVLAISSIKYVEVSNHTVTYHTEDNTVTASGSLKEIENILGEHAFCLCNQCYLVNLNYVRSVKGNDLILSDGSVLQISLPKRKVFMKQLAYFFGRGGGER